MPKYQFQHTNKNAANDAIVRTTGRIKKPKAVFDPSNNSLTRFQRLPVALTELSGVASAKNTAQERCNSFSQTSTISSDNSLVFKELCFLCGKRESKRTTFALKNPLLSCLECARKIHRFCLQVDFDDLEHVRQTYKCENCTLCDICLKNNSAGEGDNKVVTCSKCSKAFHIVCLQTCSSGSPGLNWKCPRCDSVIESTNEGDLLVKKIREIIGDHAHMDLPPNKTESNEALPASDGDSTLTKSSAKGPHLTEFHEMSKTEDTNTTCVVEQNKSCLKSPTLPQIHNISDQPLDDVPDVKSWSVNQVYEYFKIYFPKEAPVFKDQEIDGSSLLLLKRSDVINKLPLKLGPSLRIYSFILKLQEQKNEPI